jgi:hypothetical protein
MDHSMKLPASVSRSRRPHVLHGLWRGAFFGHCKRSVARVTRGEHSRGRAPLSARWKAMPGTDDPSNPTSPTGEAVDGDCLLRSYHHQSQRPYGFYDRESAARCAAEAWRRSLRRPKSPRTQFSVLNDPPDFPGRSTYGLERPGGRASLVFKQRERELAFYRQLLFLPVV